MTPERWQHIKTIVQTVLTLSEPKRNEYITYACREDGELRSEIEKLLQAIEKSEEARFMDRLNIERENLSADLSDQWHAISSRIDLIGKQIGLYKITELLGTGGMGSVFKAERSDGNFNQTVAIKLIRKGFESDENIKRFQMEQEILARLRHHNIAQLYDGGFTTDGTPFLVMEYVNGTPIDEYCNEHKLTIDERIDLFKNVCSAVQHAHSNLVIHRDLKTKNIFVTREGFVKILDFGVAKLLNPGFTDLTLLETQPGQKFWTPHYASPEQVKGESITIATDVYALGILLYKLLTDSYPLDLRGKNLAEVEKLITEYQPVLPSRAIKNNDPGQCAYLRNTSPPELRKTLLGDLDALVLKAIRKNANYRYSTVEQLLDDIDRYQKKLPLSARKGTVRYRISKFTRRNKTVLTGASLILFLVLTMGIYHVVRLAEERNIAQQEAAKAQATQDYLVGLFTAADPAENRGEPFTIQEIVERGIHRLTENFGDQPEVHSEMLKVLGRVEQALGDYTLSAELLDEALHMTRDLHGENHPDVADVAALLGDVLRWKGEFDRAESLLREALEIRRGYFTGDHADIAINMDRLARTLEMKGELEESENLYRNALAMRERLFGENSDAVSANLNNLGWLLHQKGNHTEAETTLRRSLEIKEQLLEPPHPAIASTLSNLAVVLRSLRNHEEAEKFAEQALEQEIKLHGEDHPRVTTALNNRSLILLDLGHYQEAETVYRHILENNRRQLGPDHIYVGFSLSGLAIALIGDGRSEEALPYLEEALEVTRNAVGEEHRYYAMSLALKGEALIIQDPIGAVSIYKQSIQIFERTAGDHPGMARALIGLGRAYAAGNETDLAETAFYEALGIQRRVLPAGHTNTIWTLTNLGQLLTDQGRIEEAEHHLREAVEISAERLPAGHWQRIAARVELANYLIASGQTISAQRELDTLLTELQDRTDFHGIRLWKRITELQKSVPEQTPLTADF